MNTYKADRPCAKCGNIGASSKFIPRKTEAFLYGISVEEISRTCDRCGYQWAEKPIAAVHDGPINQGKAPSVLSAVLHSEVSCPGCGQTMEFLAVNKMRCRSYRCPYRWKIYRRPTVQLEEVADE